MTKRELDWFYGGGAGRFWPETWKVFCDPIPEDERDDMIAAYHRRLFSGDHVLETRFGKTWAAWENALATVASNGKSGDSPAEYARAFSRLENHYFINGGFLEEDQQIYRDMGKIAHIPGVIVQGRYDMICPPEAAYRVASLWDKAELRMVPLAGHALSEPGISAELVKVMDGLARA